MKLTFIETLSSSYKCDNFSGKFNKLLLYIIKKQYVCANKLLILVLCGK